MTLEEALQTIREKPRHAEAWETIASDVYQPLLAYAGSLLITFRVAPGETAHDVVHQALLSFYQRCLASESKIATGSALHAYLRTSCRNLLVDQYRRERNAERLVDFLTLRSASVLGGESERYKSIILDEVLRILPSDCSSLLRHYLTEDLSLAEIADRENISPAKFYSKWYKCIERAKALLETEAVSKT